MNLFELSQEYLTVLEMAEDPEVDPKTVADTIEAIEADIEDKADSYARIITQLNGDADSLDGEIERLTARKKVLKGNADRLKRSLEEAMRATGKVKFKTPLHSFGIQKNVPSVSITDERNIPDRFLVPQPPKVDKRAIMAELKAGETFDWCELTQTESLRIR